MENVKPTVDRFEISDRSVILYVSQVVLKIGSLWLHVADCAQAVIIQFGIPYLNTLGTKM